MKIIIKTFLVLIVFMLLCVGILTAYIFRLDPNEHKDSIENIFEQSIGLKVKLNGNIHVELEEEIHVSLCSVELMDELGILAEVDSINLFIPMTWPSDSLIISSVFLNRPVYHFRTQGIKTRPSEKKESRSLSINNLEMVLFRQTEVVEGQFILYNEKDSILLNAQHINAKHIDFSINGFDEIYKEFDIESQVLIQRVKAFGFEEEKLICEFKMQNGYLHFNNRFTHYPKDKINVEINLNPQDFVYSINGNYYDQDLQDLSVYANNKNDFIKGTYDAVYNFSFTIPDSALEIKSISGNAQVTSIDALIRGVNLDKMIKTFKRTQNFSFKDVGSVLVFGPWGLAISKGGDYAGLALLSEKDSSKIELLYCEMNIDSGKVRINDLAFRTSKNRIALSGGIDFPAGEYDHFSYALVDPNGCAIIREEFDGPFEKVSNKDLNYAKMLMSPLTNLISGTSSLIVDKKCEWTYGGKVDAPQKKKLSLGFKRN